MREKKGGARRGSDASTGVRGKKKGSARRGSDASTGMVDIIVVVVAGRRQCPIRTRTEAPARTVHAVAKV